MDDLRPGPVALDTAIFIYFMEEDARFLSLVKPIFVAIDEGSLQGITSGLTLLEVLVAPYRLGDLMLAERYESLLTGSRGLRLIDLDRPLLRGAAQLRARTNLKPPDAIQIAAALATRCSAFLTNDRRLPAIAAVPILQLRDYLPRPRGRPR